MRPVFGSLLAWVLVFSTTATKRVGKAPTSNVNVRRTGSHHETKHKNTITGEFAATKQTKGDHEYTVIPSKARAPVVFSYITDRYRKIPRRRHFLRGALHRRRPWRRFPRKLFSLRRYIPRWYQRRPLYQRLFLRRGIPRLSYVHPTYLYPRSFSTPRAYVWPQYSQPLVLPVTPYAGLPDVQPNYALQLLGAGYGGRISPK